MRTTRLHSMTRSWNCPLLHLFGTVATNPPHSAQSFYPILRNLARSSATAHHPFILLLSPRRAHSPWKPACFAGRKSTRPNCRKKSALAVDRLEKFTRDVIMGRMLQSRSLMGLMGRWRITFKSWRTPEESHQIAMVSLMERTLFCYALELTFIMRSIVVHLIGWLRDPFRLVFPYMTNGTAKDYLRKSQWNQQQILKLLWEVAQGMQYLHRNNLIHSDLKADNVLVDENGVAHVADLGMSKVRRRDAMASSFSGGALQFRAPERKCPDSNDRLRILKLIDVSCCCPTVFQNNRGSRSTAIDVYAFALLMWQLFAEGKTPFAKELGVGEVGDAGDASFFVVKLLIPPTSILLKAPSPCASSGKNLH